MKILIISGFLGAGKTTFIKTMAEKTGRQFVIVENEFANAGIDGALLKQEKEISGTEAMRIWELSEGCICCSLNLDFSQSVLTIANTLDPDYLIVEPSGVAMPGRIIEQLHKISYENIGLLAPITIVDAVHFRESRRSFSEYFSNQLFNAGMLVLSKSENMSEEEFEAAGRELEIREETVFPLRHYTKWTKEEWLSVLHRELKVEKRSGNGMPVLSFVQNELPKEQLMDSITIEKINLPSPDILVFVLELFIRGAFGRIVRSKGFVRIGRQGFRYDLVDGEYAVTGFDNEEDSRLVIIGQNLKKQEIKELLEEAFRKKIRYRTPGYLK